MAAVDPPEYRIRLFLSVDLVGSTAFKSESGKSNIEWIKAFQKFYGEFPSQLSKNYTAICEGIPEVNETEKLDTPKVWKTIGDEILFVNRIRSITQLGVYVTAFSQTLKDFGHEINLAFNLNTKGNAWIAAFPTPNRSIRLSTNSLVDPLIGDNIILTEEFEAQVDENPREYDFLGKGIDGGFRISRNSTVETFTISPALAHLLCKAKRNNDTTSFDCNFRFHPPQEFKGVMNGATYPVITIDTSRNAEKNEILRLESELLNKPMDADFVTLAKYLDKYISLHGIERPELKLTANSASVEPPAHYKDYMERWKVNLASIEASIEQEEEAASSDDPQGERRADAEEVDPIEILRQTKLAIDAWNSGAVLKNLKLSLQARQHERPSNGDSQGDGAA